jgi:Tfp pilus assembly protein FimT
MRMRKNQANSNTPRMGGGFSAIELLITAAILTIVTAFGVLGISRAKANIRLAGAAREYASYIEKARVFSIRSHADDASERASVAISDDRTSYTVTLDLDGDGDLDTRTIPLPEGVTFDTVETIAFDWRGRTWNTVGAVTTPNAQVSIRLQNSIESVSVDVTGSGDITIDSRVFDDSVPNVNLNVGDLVAGATPVPTPDTGHVLTSPTDVIITPPDPTIDPNLDPPTDTIDTTPLPDPNPVLDAPPTPAPTPSRATPTPSPTPAPVLCTITTDQVLLRLGMDGTTTIKVSHSSSGSLSITGTSSKPSELQVTPGGAQATAAGGVTTFTIKSKKSSGAYTVTFSSSCGSTVVPVTVLL